MTPLVNAWPNSIPANIGEPNLRAQDESSRNGKDFDVVML
jgi:hypothetical protein